MIEAYAIGVSLTLKDNASKRMSSFTKMASDAAKAVAALNKEMGPLAESLVRSSELLATLNPALRTTATGFGALSKSVSPATKGFFNFNSKIGSTIARTETLSTKISTLTTKIAGLNDVSSKTDLKNIRGGGGGAGGGRHGFHAGHIFREAGLGKLALLGGAGYAGGGALMGGLAAVMLVRSSYENASRFQQAQSQFAGQGFGAAADKQAANAAIRMNIRGVSSTEALQAINDAATVTRNVPEAIQLAPSIAKMEFANRVNYAQRGRSFTSADEMRMLQFSELRSGTTDPDKFLHTLNLVEQAYASDAARLTTNDVRTAGRQGASALKMLSERGFIELLPLMQSLGGARTMTGVTTLETSMAKGQNMRTGKRAELEFERLGISKDGKILPQYYKQLTQSPVDFLYDTLLPAMARKGITSEAQISQEFGVLFTQSVSRVLQQAIAQQPRIMAQLGLVPQASGIQAGYMTALSSNPGHILALQQSWDSMMTAFGKFSSPMVNKGIDALIYLFDHIAFLANGGDYSAKLSTYLQKNHPTLAKINDYMHSSSLESYINKKPGSAPVVNVHAQISTADGHELGQAVLKNILASSQLTQNSMSSAYSPSMTPITSGWSGN